MIAITADFIVNKSKLEEVKKTIKEFVHAVHVSEPGTKAYVSLQEEENEFRFIHFMVFESKGAEEKHKNAPHTERFTEYLYKNCKSKPVFKNYTYIAGL